MEGRRMDDDPIVDWFCLHLLECHCLEYDGSHNGRQTMNIQASKQTSQINASHVNKKTFKYWHCQRWSMNRKGNPHHWTARRHSLCKSREAIGPRADVVLFINHCPSPYFYAVSSLPKRWKISRSESGLCCLSSTRPQRSTTAYTNRFSILTTRPWRRNVYFYTGIRLLSALFFSFCVLLSAISGSSSPLSPHLSHAVTENQSARLDGDPRTALEKKERKKGKSGRENIETVANCWLWSCLPPPSQLINFRSDQGTLIRYLSHTELHSDALPCTVLSSAAQ